MEECRYIESRCLTAGLALQLDTAEEGYAC